MALLLGVAMIAGILAAAGVLIMAQGLSAINAVG